MKLIWAAGALASCMMGCAREGFADGQNLSLPDQAREGQNAQEVDFNGVAIRPGLLFLPAAFIEGGYDTNPDQKYVEKASAFFRTGASLNLTAISARSAATINTSGSWLGYADSVENNPRLSGSVSGDFLYKLAPEWTVSSKVGLAHDETTLAPSETFGSTGTLSYRNEIVSSFVRGSFSEVRYLDSETSHQTSTFAPLALTSTFNYQRTEAVIGGIVQANSRTGVYSETGIAAVDYTHQERSFGIDRSAGDYYTKGGVRVAVSPTLSTDLGWRVNWRGLDDPTIRSYDSNFFDGGLTWTPSRFFSIGGSIERTIGEPSTLFGRLADVRSYEVKTLYSPIAGITLNVRGSRQLVNEIGGDFRYHSTILDAEATYDYSQRVQLYSSARYEHFSVDYSDNDYDRFRFLVGLRFVPDGKSLTAGHTEDLFERLKEVRLIKNGDLSVSVGYSAFDLPGVKMATVIGGPFFDQALYQQTNDDGHLDGVRTDLRLDHFAEHVFPDGRWLSFGLAGFYGRYESSSRSNCTYTATTDCAFVNIVDFNPVQENNTGAFGDLHIKTKRQVNYYGVSIDAHLGSWIEGGYKDDAGERELSPFKVGLSLRGLNERTQLKSFDPLVCDPVRYDERLETGYYGAFIGFDKNIPLKPLWSLSVDSTAGVYYADTTFRGFYKGYVATVGKGYVTEYGSADGRTENVAFIGSLKLGLNRETLWGTVGVFGQGEYLSYVPSVYYNNNDYAGGSPFGIVGTHTKTGIGSDDAFNYTFGVNFRVKFD